MNKICYTVVLGTIRTNTSTIIKPNFRKFYINCKALFEKEVNSRNNFQFQLVSPKMSDVQIIALSLVDRQKQKRLPFQQPFNCV
jgi:hypothetical protein